MYRGRGADISALLQGQTVQKPGLDPDSVNPASSEGRREFILEPRMNDCGMGT